jgi:hypothetical protein
MKIVVFDLDETLGYFVEFSVFWNCLQQYFTNEKIEYSFTQEDFNQIFDLYPEFLRPNIMTLLKYLMYKKKSKCCHKMLIYTNNQGPKHWCKQLISYFEHKLNFELFDQIINAFKINGEVIEIGRTSHDKSFHDLIKCTKIPPNSEICFLDDCYYPEMANDQVYYINVKPYIHDLDFRVMIQRFLDSKILLIHFFKKDSREGFETKMNRIFIPYDYFVMPKTVEETNIDKIVSKQILIHLQEFFEQSRPRNNKLKKSYKQGISLNKNKSKNNKTKKNKK